MTVTLLVPAAVLSIAAPALQTDGRSVSVSVPALPAARAVNELARQTGVSVVITTDLSSRSTAPLAGRYTAEEAFARLLAPLGARATRLGPGVFRVEAAPRRVVVAERAVVPVRAEPTLLDEVVVTAPVRRGDLEGVNGRSALDDAALVRADARLSSDSIANLSASVDSTRQGPGRNKLFVRGIADSALSGPLQATVGQYLGEFRLGFGAPDPDIALVDVRRIEVFEGPQGSRFGAGSIGGVVRLEPEPPDPSVRLGRVMGALSTTRGGAPGADGSLVLNQPLGPGSGLRLVAYARRDGGFVDENARDEEDADSLETQGVRLAWRTTAQGWTVDLLGVSQSVSAGDTPLARTGDPPYGPEGVPQPYDSRLSLAGLALSRRISRMEATVAASVSRQTLHETFDASIPEDGVLARTTRRQATDAASIEARIRTVLGGVWTLNGGVSLAQAQTGSLRIQHAAETGERPYAEASLKRTYRETAVFGQAVARLSPELALTFGGRLARVQIDTGVGRSAGAADAAPVGAHGEEAVAIPSLGFRWTPEWGGAVFGRLEDAVRPGDVSEAGGVGRPYRSDRVRLLEFGVATPSAGRWRLEASAGLLDWRDIQSDTVTVGGDLVTDNIGDGRIVFVQLKAAGEISDQLHVSGAVFLNDNRLDLPGPSLIGIPEGDIPNVARASGQMSLDYGPIPLGDYDLNLAGDFRYVGRSRPGLGPGLDQSQGGYLNADLTARLGSERGAIVLSVSNPLDLSATRFAIGSPYRLYDGGAVPLRPRTIRLGFEARF